MPSPLIISSDQASTIALTTDQSSVTVNPGISVSGPDSGFGIDATAGAGGTIFLYGSLSAGGGIYDPSTTRNSYNIVLYSQASISASSGYGIALQKQASVINHGRIEATQTGISLGDGNSIVVNNGSIAAEIGLQAYGHGTIIENAGSIIGSKNAMVVTGDNCTITNNGLVEGSQFGIVLAEVTGTATVITNTGTLTGGYLAFQGSRAGNELINRGLITGSVDFRGGDDVFDNRQGKITGTVLLGTGDDKALGGSGSEVFSDWLGNDTIDAGGGIDTLSYELSTDPNLSAHVDLRIETEQTSVWGTDTFLNFENVVGSAGADTITGSDGDNVLKGLTGLDSLSGAKGNDTLEGGADNDVLDGGDGVDTAVYAGTAIVTVDLRLEVVQNTGLGNDILTGIENLVGGSAADRLTGNSVDNRLQGGDSADLLFGNEGADHLDGEAGNDVLDGGSGSDTAVFSSSRSSYSVVANADGTITITDNRAEGDGKDVLTSIEYLQFSDVTVAAPLYAPPPQPVTASAPVPLNLYGTSRADRLTGGDGNDKLWGKLGKDVLFGGKGKDVFVFNTKLNKKTNLDKIADFNVKDDTIWLDNAIFKKLGKGSELKPGKLNKAFFSIGDHAKDKNDYLIYDNKQGVLFYDADGSGKGKAMEIATLSKKLKMTVDDFKII
ncbi:calcium-binding protein [Microvirga rosea]|uniref:calcium-binding protein n=1 Tax=Microvirga rosea TaxID=2715425 RepID=UPI001D09B59D|nr:calcium-binding protein [Microvirga rosea]MCB8820295.1 hypothetical protein [Microvirga rosea]